MGKKLSFAVSVAILRNTYDKDFNVIYAYVKITVTVPSALAQYREVAEQALAKHGGKVVSVSSEFTVLDGSPDEPDVGAVLSFPDRTSAIKWASDPELKDIHEMRRSAGGSDILLLG